MRYYSYLLVAYLQDQQFKCCLLKTSILNAFWIFLFLVCFTFLLTVTLLLSSSYKTSFSIVGLSASFLLNLVRKSPRTLCPSTGIRSISSTSNRYINISKRFVKKLINHPWKFMMTSIILSVFSVSNALSRKTKTT